MKKTLIASFCAALCIMFAGCGQSPADVAKKWQKTIIANNVAAADSLSVEQNKSMNSSLISMISKDADLRDAFRAISFTREEITGDTATVYFKNNNGDTASLALVKVDGKWKMQPQRGLQRSLQRSRRR